MLTNKGKLITPQDCLIKYGEPSLKNPFLTLYDIPKELEIGAIPNKVYCNKDLVAPLTNAIELLKLKGLHDEIKTYDGCFNIRNTRESTKQSLHSWAIAIDFNAFENGLRQKPKLSDKFVMCFLDSGFHWGGLFKRLDGMHFQLAKI